MERIEMLPSCYRMTHIHIMCNSHTLKQLDLWIHQDDSMYDTMTFRFWNFRVWMKKKTTLIHLETTMRTIQGN